MAIDILSLFKQIAGSAKKTATDDLDNALAVFGFNSYQAARKKGLTPHQAKAAVQNTQPKPTTPPPPPKYNLSNYGAEGTLPIPFQREEGSLPTDKYVMPVVHNVAEGKVGPSFDVAGNKVNPLQIASSFLSLPTRQDEKDTARYKKILTTPRNQISKADSDWAKAYYNDKISQQGMAMMGSMETGPAKKVVSEAGQSFFSKIAGQIEKLSPSAKAKVESEAGPIVEDITKQATKNIQGLEEGATKAVGNATEGIETRLLPKSPELPPPPGTKLPPGAEPGLLESGQKGSSGQTISNNDNAVNRLLDGANARINDVYTKTLDRFHPLSVMAKKAGKDSAQAMQDALTGHYGAGSTAKYHTDFQLGPILRESNVNDLKDAAVAMRDLELSGRGIKGSNLGTEDLTKLADGGDAQARNALGRLQKLKDKLGPEGMDKLGGTLKKLYDYQNNLVKEYLVDTGVMSKEAFDKMKADNQFYVPFKRQMDKIDEFLGVPGKQAGNVSGQNVLFKIKGSDKAIEDPIESIVENTYKTVGIGQRQKVAQTIVGLKDKLPEGMVEKIKGDVGNKPHISLFENGKVQKYSVPQEVADAAKGLNADAMGTLTKLLAAPTRVFRATATGINPEFALPNVARDITSAFVNVGVNPIDWAKGVAHMAKQDQVFQDFLKSGGMTSRVSLDRPFLKETAGNLAKGGENLAGRAKRSLSISKPSDLYNILEMMGQYSEQPTRIASYEKAFNNAVKEGLTKDAAAKKAAYAAQEGTVNFARRGSETQSLNAIYAFLNARAQGTDRFIRTMKNDPKGAAVRTAMVTLAPALATYAWNRNFKSFTDPRIVSQTDKDNNFIIMVSDKPVPQLGGAQYIKIPKGDVGKLANPIESFLSYADGKGGDVASSIGKAIQAFSPIQDIGETIPTALRPVVETAANHSFFTGQSIVPDYQKNYPAENQSGSYTAPIYNDAAKFAAEKLGIHISPSQAQNLIEGYTTGYGKMGGQFLSQFASPKAKEGTKLDQGQNINSTPVVRRFLGGEKRTAEEQQSADLSKLKSRAFDIADVQIGINSGKIDAKNGTATINAYKKEQKDILDKAGGYVQDTDRIYYTDGDGSRYVTTTNAGIKRGTVKVNGEDHTVTDKEANDYNSNVNSAAAKYVPKLMKSQIWQKASADDRASLMKQLMGEIKDSVFSQVFQ